MQKYIKLPQTISILHSFPSPFAPLMRGSGALRFDRPMRSIPCLLFPRFLCRRLSGGVRLAPSNKRERNGEDRGREILLVCGSF